MSQIKKPEKKKHSEWCRSRIGTNFQCNCMHPDYNQAYDDWAEYHNWVLSKLPSYDELKEMLERLISSQYLGGNPPSAYTIKTNIIAKAISKRLRGDK